MKKIFVLTLFLTFLLNACNRNEMLQFPQKQANNRLVTIFGNEKTNNLTIMMFTIGHDAKDCRGCIIDNGRLYHIDCMGEGTKCTASASVHLQQNGSTVTATTTDTFDLTSLDFFLMPDRSLTYTDEKGNNVFLNIPAQLVYRDSTTRQFTFTGLFYTDYQYYNND